MSADELSGEHFAVVDRDAIDGVRVLPWSDIGPTLTCHETEMLAALLAACGLDQAAEALLEGHAESDEEGDRHYRPEATR